ncbi:MAG TPA: MEDS domain-containing protein, partial [Candidatus Thermoplasmatota archaeon]|nr:MEDS domain-containing protein [Candidatus Thermoplasmatota archaeon]
ASPRPPFPHERPYSGSAEAAASLRLGDHTCAIYDGRDELVAMMSAYIQAGLQRNEQCFYIADSLPLEEVRTALRLAGVDVAGAEATGQLVLVTKRDTYLREGDFQPDAMLAFLHQACDAALERHDGARGMGEMAWAAELPDGFRRLIEYENKVNLLMPQVRFAGFCAYDRQRFPASVLTEVVRAHTMVIHRGRAYRNFFYVPPEEYLRERKPEVELQRLLDNLAAREALEAERLEALDRQRELERLRDAERVKDELLGAAAHELANPLTPLRMQVELLKQGATAEQQRHLAVMERALQRMAQLLADVMLTVRLRQGTGLGETSRIMVGRLVQDVLEELEPVAREKRLHVEATTVAAWAQVDQRKVLQAVYNLVSNAIKYTPSGGRIRIAVAPAGDGVEVRVADNGPGLAAHDIERIFGSFVRLEGHASIPGSGLGLFVSRLVAEQHGGTLKAESGGPGKGSTFVLWLPFVPVLARRSPSSEVDALLRP